MLLCQHILHILTKIRIKYIIYKNSLGEVMKPQFLAIDIGASSGRHILGYEDNGEVVLNEVYRFKNGVVKENGRLLWDVQSLFLEIKNGIKKAFEFTKNIVSLSIDTWGIDYVLLKDDKEVLPCYAYRDIRGELATNKVHNIISYEELYKFTGVTYNSYNTIYQLYDDLQNGRLDGVTDFLMLPEYFSYKLTGVKAKEYTNATTTGLVNAVTKDFDKQIINKLGFNEQIFKTPVMPGFELGSLKCDIANEVGGNCKVILCASHDTASAVYGIPMEGNSPYVSSGTWSLLGIKTQNAIVDRGSDISNEGGVGYFRHQKNIMGMWLVNRLQETLDSKLSLKEMDALAEQSNYSEVFDVNDNSLFAPENMKLAILSLLDKTGKKMPESEGDIISSVYHSLAYGYAQTYKSLEENTGKTYKELYIVGGGAKNKVLNALTEKYSGKKVIALPIEATALGNLKIQIEKYNQNNG